MLLFQCVIVAFEAHAVVCFSVLLTLLQWYTHQITAYICDQNSVREDMLDKSCCPSTLQINTGLSSWLQNDTSRDFS